MTTNPVEKETQSPASQRASARTSIRSIKIRCDGEVYVPADWGLGGCRIAGYRGDLRPGTTVLLELFLNVVHEHDGLPVKAEVVRFDAEHDNSLAFRFIDLTAQDIFEFCGPVDEAPADAEG